MKGHRSNPKTNLEHEEKKHLVVVNLNDAHTRVSLSMVVGKRWYAKACPIGIPPRFSLLEEKVTVGQQTMTDNDITPSGSSANASEGVYAVVSFADLSVLTYSLDHGWIGARSADLAWYSSSMNASESGGGGGQPSASPTVTLIGVIPHGSVVAYGVLLGCQRSRQSLREVVKKDVPKHWEHVVRIGWIRCADAASMADTQDEVSTPLQQVLDIANGTPMSTSLMDGDSALWTPLEDAKAGAAVCALVDAGSMATLPPGLRNVAAHTPGTEITVTPSAPSGTSALTIPAPSSSTSSTVHTHYTLEQFRLWVATYYPSLSQQEKEAYADQCFHAQQQAISAPLPESH